MNILGQFSVFPTLPASISRLEALANNLWWAWHDDAQALYKTLSAEIWEATNHNPIKLLREVPQARLDEAAQDQTFLVQYKEVLRQFDAYMGQKDTWFRQNHADYQDGPIAYFSAEFGLHEVLPIYSGGLGILSGDHCKAASDLGLPFVGIGFLYPQGYFTQKINHDGYQEAEYEKLDFSEVPALPAKDTDGNDIIVNVKLPGRIVYARVWEIRVGRINLYLMDTDVSQNAQQDRDLSARLYGGDKEIRIAQEIVLGIGGVRALNALGIRPAVYHMNEGHAAFLGLERIRQFMVNDALTFDESVELTKASNLFTTHTPVAAGNDAFSFELMDKYFSFYWGELGLTRESFLDLGRWNTPWGMQFSMTVLAIRLSCLHNGVSQLHGAVSRRMWSDLWPGLPLAEVPISAVTNGVHLESWLSPRLSALIEEKSAPQWQDDQDNPAFWNVTDRIEDQALWEVHQADKKALIKLLRQRIQQQRLRHGETVQQINASVTLLDPEALTIGFARRYATYKRAMLIFRDMERIKRILSDPEHPVQIVFAGKAHPADEPGKALIQQIYQLAQQPAFQGKVLFVENYDINIARHLVQGVDVWLNNPRRPLEASGTSGQKAGLNGVLNFSVLDGWWPEGYNGTNGWAIGEERTYKDETTQDEADALSLYAQLERGIIPLFFARDENGVPVQWVQRMKASIQSIAPQFNTRRMVKEYFNRYYFPAAEQQVRLSGSHYQLGKALAAWKARMRQLWPTISLRAEGPQDGHWTVGKAIEVAAYLFPGTIKPEEIAVELVVIRRNGQEGPVTAIEMAQQKVQEDGTFVYRGAFQTSQNGHYVYGVRATPKHPALANPFELGLVRWA